MLKFDYVQIVEGAGFIDDLLMVLGLGFAAVLVFTGLIPALFRLGNGLARRKIAIFAAPEAYGELRQLLLDSGLFKGWNIFHVHSPSEGGAADKATIFLAYWPDWGQFFEAFIDLRRPSVPCIVYAPRSFGLIAEEQMSVLDQHRHTTVTNFRGRLLNDIVTAMITSSYEK